MEKYTPNGGQLAGGPPYFPYVASWARDKAVLKNVLGTIQTASAYLIEGVRATAPGTVHATERLDQEPPPAASASAPDVLQPRLF